jgi:predicted DNA-binding transcriptional regulator YafY
MYDDSPKRFDRIVAILIQLQSKKIVKAQDLADRFGVSLRTIYRDIRSLETSGVPVYGEAGSGYMLVDGYRLPPVMFTREEASSFIAAEKLMSHFPDRELGQHYQSAMYKLKAVLRTSEKDLVNELGAKVLVRTPNHLFNQKAPNALATIFRSMGEKTQVVLDYEAIAAEAPSQRIIEPVGVFHENSQWYIYAYCHLRNDYRQFRTDRIHGMAATGKAFTQQHKALEDYLDSKKPVKLTKVRIAVDKPVAKYLSHERGNHGFVSEKNLGNRMEMTFMSPDLENGFARWFLMFGDYATVLEPQALKVRLSQLLASSQANLLKK